MECKVINYYEAAVRVITGNTTYFCLRDIYQAILVGSLRNYIGSLSNFRRGLSAAYIRTFSLKELRGGGATISQEFLAISGYHTTAYVSLDALFYYERTKPGRLCSDFLNWLSQFGATDIVIEKDGDTTLEVTSKDSSVEQVALKVRAVINEEVRERLKPLKAKFKTLLTDMGDLKSVLDEAQSSYKDLLRNTVELMDELEGGYND